MSEAERLDLAEISLASEHLLGPADVKIYTPTPLPGEPLGVVIALHGGVGAPFGDLVAGLVNEERRAGTIRPCVVAVPHSERSFWMDFRDGSQNWESFVLDTLLEHVRAVPGVDAETPPALVGVSMGGMGALRIAFGHPETFRAVAACEPAVEPAMTWDEVRPGNLFYRPIETMERIFGSPIDADFWNEHNVAAVAEARARALRDSGLEIYIEVGDEDCLRLDEGVEYLHRLLQANDIGHEYHLVRHADHIGMSLLDRTREAVRFLGRAFDPPPPEADAGAVEALLAEVTAWGGADDWTDYLARNPRS